ncbi:MAG: hypothetical protein HY899_02195 [Deltaproteobacteria bacterium]|nr:hypothetical protein [Deltaproteobacteria bacterium]
MRLSTPPTRSLLAGVIAALALLTPCATPTSAAEVDGYTPGRGLALFENRLIIGGYLAMNLSLLDQTPDRFAPEDLSLFVTWQPADHFKFFGEFEAEDAVVLDGSGLHTSHAGASLERLYAEWEPSDVLRLRLGKMLTPIGIWNLIHAAPLVWTVSRPLATMDFFDTGVTGAVLDVTVLRGDDVDLVATAFGQATDQLDDTGAPHAFRRAAGGRLELSTTQGPRAGLSYVRFDDRNDDHWESTFGCDFFWETGRFELSAEASVNDPSSGATTWGAYTQLVYHPRWTLRLHPVARIEYVDLGTVERTPFVFGMAWKPSLGTIVKIEGIVGGDDTNLGGEGLLASLAVLF